MAWMPPPVGKSQQLPFFEISMYITCALEHEAKHIPSNEDLGKPLLSHQRIPLSIYQENYAAKYNVY
jgi:hypothetical protein